MAFDNGLKRPYNGRVVDSGNAKDFPTVQCFPLYSILLAVNRTTVDYLSLDVEGHEMQIIKTIPWHKINVTVCRINNPLSNVMCVMISNDAYYSHEGGDGGMDSIGTGRRRGDESLHEPTRLCPFRPHLGIHNAGRCLRSRFPPRIPQLAVIAAEQPSIRYMRKSAGVIAAVRWHYHNLFAQYRQPLNLFQFQN